MTGASRIVDLLTAVLYDLSTALLLPTLVLLLAFMAGTLVLLGGLVREWAERRAAFGPWRRFLDRLRRGAAVADEFGSLRLAGYPRRVQQATHGVQHRPRLVRKSLADNELDMSRRLGLRGDDGG